MKKAIVTLDIIIFSIGILICMIGVSALDMDSMIPIIMTVVGAVITAIAFGNLVIIEEYTRG